MTIWGHLTLACLAGTKSASSLSFLKYGDKNLVRDSAKVACQKLKKQLQLTMLKLTRMVSNCNKGQGCAITQGSGIDVEEKKHGPQSH